MARSIPVIYNQLLAAKNAQSSLSALNSNSQVSIWNLWLWITAVGQSLFEQLCDLFQANMETLIANAPVFTLEWIAQMCKNFQYSVSNPQVVQLNVSNTYPYLSIGYPSVNTSLQIITQAAAVNNSNNQIIVKVASNSAPLSMAQITALKSYLAVILPPNVNYIVISDSPDVILIQAQVFYNAAYSGVIQGNMDIAIGNFLAAIPFNGEVAVSGLEEAMLAVTGVSDVVLNNVYWRKAGDPVPTGGPPPTNMPNQLVNGDAVTITNNIVNRKYQTYAGYVVPETTAGYALNDLITYIPS